jgi:quercetin dioxygenase-like cupin family protein/ribosome-binding protein aMBF1 (putative translation factor)
MDEDRKESPYEDLQQTVDEYGEHGGDDLLTDPDADARAKERVKREAALDHRPMLRAAREERGFTLAELSEKTGIASDVLARMESGETFLPLGELIKVTKVLALKMTDVLAAGTESFTIVRANERQSVKRFGETRQTSHGYEYESLAPGKKDKTMEPFIVTLHPAASDELSSHDGQEFIYVLEGEMTVVVEGHRDVLHPGDAVYYDGTSKHLVAAHGDKPAKILAVIVS